MRIAIVNSIRVSGGGEKWLARQAGTWQRRGHEPILICQPGAGVEQMAKDAELPVKNVWMPHDVSVPAVLGIARELREARAELVLCCNERAYRLAAPATRLAGGPPLVYRNGLTATFKNKAFNRLFFRWVSRFVVISEPLREEMASYGWIPDEKLQLIRNGIDPSLFDPDPGARERVRRELGAAPDAVVAGVVARVTEDKGQVETIEAFANLASELPRTELWIVGEGNLRPKLEALARERGVAERVRFPGFRKDVPAVFQALDVVVQASHREGLGNTLLEAMAAHRPIVAAAVGGIVDVVVPGETGTLVPPYDVPALTTALRPLLADVSLRRQYGEAGRRRVEEHFPLDGETDRWCQLFAELGARSGAVPARSTPAAAPGARR